MSPADTIAQPALWPLSLIVFLPALVAAVMALPVIHVSTSILCAVCLPVNLLAHFCLQKLSNLRYVDGREPAFRGGDFHWRIHQDRLPRPCCSIW